MKKKERTLLYNFCQKTGELLPQNVMFQIFIKLYISLEIVDCKFVD